ncbi:hypothetical protein HOLleu_43549 [Holothuria leucospilota]|uniref:Uncharacterized protein n=1 Tax=Holothuria leucospilota TaxID=206669 RepID=A0A9Q1B9N9_HOLLE|nr:hypothetical protein HOLleu_43549 [Holothuria leucospilota]
MEMDRVTAYLVQEGGFYQDQIGMKKCKTCVDGTFVNNTNASSFAQCTLCPEGTNQTRLAGYRACFCKANYSRTNRFMGCSICEDNGVNCSFDYKFLRPGFYWNWSFPSTNLTAYAQFVANLQTNSSLYDMDTIEYNDLMPYAHDCPNDYSCPNNKSHTVGRLSGTCAKGYRGWMCYQCENNYYRVLNSCRQCPGHWWIISETILVVVIVLGALYFLICQSKDKRKALQSGERSLVDKVSSRLKIILGFYQVVGELFESLHDINWVGPLSSVGRLLSFRNINAFSLFVRPRCLNSNFVFDSKLQFKIALTFPVFVFMTAILVYIVGKLILVRKFYKNRSDMTHHVVKLRSKIYFYILLLLFVTYTPTCVAIFAFYHKACQEFLKYQGINETISLLRSDFDVECDEKLEAYHIAAYVGTVVHVITFPLILLYLLNKYGKQGDVRGEDNAIEDETKHHERTSLLSPSEVRPIPFWMKFICENYKPRFWYWEVVELARKATQTAFVTLLGWDDSLTLLSTIGLSVLFLTLHAKFSPMKSSFEQRLQMFSLTAIFINVLIVAVDIPHEYGELVSTPLILLNLIIIVTITGEMALGIIRFVRDKYFRH